MADEFDLDLDRLASELREATRTIDLVVHPADAPSPLGTRLAALAQRVSELSGGSVRLRRQADSELPDRPALALGHGGDERIRYHALPEGPEGPPFVEAVLEMACRRKTPQTTAGLSASLSQLSKPVDLVVFMAAACPHCPEAVRAAVRVTLESPLVHTTVVDVQHFEGWAKRLGILSVPTTILDDALTITAVVPPQTLVERCLSRDGPDYELEVLRSLISAQRIDDAASRMLTAPGAEAFAAAWAKSTMSMRMGLMMAAEEAIDQDAEALHGVVGTLLSTLDSEDVALKGDTADLLGQVGHPDAIAPLEALLGHSDPDVAGAAEDALEEIRGA